MRCFRGMVVRCSATLSIVTVRSVWSTIERMNGSLDGKASFAIVTQTDSKEMLSVAMLLPNVWGVIATTGWSRSSE